MSKEIKPSIKNKQLASSLNLGKLKDKLIKNQNKDQTEEEPPVEKKPKTAAKAKKAPAEVKLKKVKEEKVTPKVKAEPVKEVLEKVESSPAPHVSPEKAEVKPKAQEPKKEEKIKETFQHILKTDRPIKIKRDAKEKESDKPAPEVVKENTLTVTETKKEDKKAPLKIKKNIKGYHDLPPLKRSPQQPGNFDSRGRQGLVSPDEGTWQRRRRPRNKIKSKAEDTTIRPSNLKVRLPISIKDLCAAMKIKASQLLSVLFKQGLTLTLNDVLDDETTVQLLGQEFSCEIEIDTDEHDRIQVTDKSLKEEIQSIDPAELEIRPPVVTFMGHVDHGKTSLIDSIRKSNRASSEAGDITQHIGAFQSKTSHGYITILDTPGHEAFSAMRNRGATVTDIVVLVIAGDEGVRDQTIEALNQAKEAKVTIIVAINKSDKENFDPEPIYRALADQELIPEAWGGSTITVNCSAKSGEGISNLLELIALQSEVLELKASPKHRARGTVLESEVHKGLGNVATLLIQNGTLNVGDAIVFDCYYARIKTMINDYGKNLQHAPPSTPVEITGMSGLPEAGSGFIVVKSEKEAKEIAGIRMRDFKALRSTYRNKSKLKDHFMDSEKNQIDKKVLPLIIRADVQGSLEALKHSLNKIETQKVDLNIISEGVGEVTESDIQLSKTSGACIIGFHTRIESHAEELMKNLNVSIKMPKVIYEAVDIVKEMMIDQLDLLPQENEKGKLAVKAVFKASRIGKIAGCSVVSGNIQRNQSARLIRNGEVVWKGNIASLKREKEDVKEVRKGMECGVVLDNFSLIEEGDSIETFEITYHKQDL